MRDWLNAFLPASFRGVPFKVDIEGTAGARRLSVSPIAYAETSVIEDMGRDPSTYEVTAYTAGDAADFNSVPLVAALQRKGAGMLILPMQGPRLVRVQYWSLSRYKSRAGFVAFDITFVEQGLSAVPFSAGAAAGRLSDAMTAIVAIASSAFAVAVSATPRHRLDAVMVAARQSAQTVSTLAPLASTTSLLSGPARSVAAVSVAAEAAVSSPGTFVAGIVDAWRVIGRHCDPERSFDLISADMVLVRQDTPVRPLELAAMAGALSIASVRREYRTRSDAQNARTALAAASAPAIESASMFGADVRDRVSSITGQAAIEISRIAADRAPLVRVETGISLPSVVAAYRLYGDANRAGEIVGRNQVGTPAMMPVRFEAVAP